MEKEYPAALQALEEEKTRNDLGGFLLGMMEITALEAVVRHQLGDREGAFKTLERAYGAASSNALDMPFVELGEDMYGLVNAVLKEKAEGKGGAESACQGIPQDWLYTIRRKTSAYAKQSSLVAAQYSETAALPAVSNWELEILNSLSRGRTSEEITGEMKIPANMIKSAIRSLYVKLGAVNRADAIRIASEKGLISYQ
jgi:LuxR family maltose regulon positive regulatory protein